MKKVLKQEIKKAFKALEIEPAQIAAKNLIAILTRKLFRKRLIVIVASPHKVGSTWLFQMLKELGKFQSKSLPEDFSETGTLVLDNHKILPYLSRGYGWYIFKSHSYPIKYSIPPGLAKDLKIVTIVRDPRDVIVSASFYLAYLEQEKGGWGEDFRKLREMERILKVIREGDFLLNRLEEWFRSATAYTVRYEKLIKNPVEEMRVLSKHINFKVKRKEIEKIVKKYSFNSQAGRKPGGEKKDAFLRKGIVGDWKNYFDQSCITAFKTEKQGRWNSLLLEMGYETQPDWN